MAEFHVYSQTVADGTATSVVRPSDWNSAHQHIVTLSGNTSNASTISGTNIVFQGGNNVTLSGTQAAGAATIVISAPTQSAQTQSNVQGISAGTQVGRTGDIVFANSNGITFGMSNSNQVTASHNGLTSQSNQAFSAAGGSSAFQTLVFADSNGVSWTNTNGSVAATVRTDYASSAHGHTLTVSAQSNTTQSSSGTLNMAGLNVQGAGIVSVGVSNNSLVISATAGGGATPIASASNGSFSFTTLGFSNANNVTFGTSAGSIITASVAAPGAAAEQNAINLLGANTAGNTTATGSTIGWSGVNVTLSGTNASQVVISAPATSSLVGDRGLSISTAGSTISIQAPVLSYMFLPNEDQITNLSAHANGTMSIQNRLALAAYSATQLVVPMNISSVATAGNNSTAGINFSISFAVYSENANTLSSMSSTTFSTAGTWTSNATGSVTGAVFMSTPFNMLLTPGEYYFGMNISTAATGGAITGAATTSLGNTISIMGANTAVFGAFSWHTLGSSTNQSIAWAEQGLYTGTTAFSGGINIANLSMQGTAAQRANFGAILKAL